MQERQRNVQDNVMHVAELLLLLFEVAVEVAIVVSSGPYTNKNCPQSRPFIRFLIFVETSGKIHLEKLGVVHRGSSWTRSTGVMIHGPEVHVLYSSVIDDNLSNRLGTSKLRRLNQSVLKSLQS